VEVVVELDTDESGDKGSVLPSAVNSFSSNGRRRGRRGRRKRFISRKREEKKNLIISMATEHIK